MGFEFSLRDAYDKTFQTLKTINAHIFEDRQRIVDLDCAMAGHSRFDQGVINFQQRIHDSNTTAMERLQLFWKMGFRPDTTEIQQYTTAKSWDEMEYRYEYYFSCTWHDCGKDSNGKDISCCYKWGYHWATHTYYYSELTSIVNEYEGIIQGTPFSLQPLKCGYYSRDFSTLRPITYVTYESPHIQSGDRMTGITYVNFKKEYGSHATLSYSLDANVVNSDVSVLRTPNQNLAAADLTEKLYQFLGTAIAAFNLVGGDYPALQERIREEIPVLLDQANVPATLLHQQGVNPIAPCKITRENRDLLHDALWIDLFTPTKEEEKYLEDWLQTDIPTRDEMAEIELSSRLYKENSILFITAMLIAQSDSLDPKLDPITFVLTEKQLITIRYIEPQAFKIFCAHLKKISPENLNAPSLLIELLDTCIDRLADIMEYIGKHLDDYSKTIFRSDANTENKLDYQKLMLTLGANGDLNTKARESVLSFQRLLSFFEQSIGSKLPLDEHPRVAILGKDVASLGDHATFVSSKVNFLLDATLGLVNIEKNNIIKIFSVVAVLFLPPTLIASIYGMNFHLMPELAWKYGYLFALCAILLAAWLPYKYFKYRKWL